MELTREYIIKTYKTTDFFKLLELIDHNDDKLMKFVFTHFGSRKHFDWKISV